VATLADALQKYLDYKTLRPKTAANYEMFLQRCVPDLLSMPLDKITKEKCLERHKKLRLAKSTHSNGSGAQANHVFKTIRAIFNFSIVYYDLDIKNPVDVFSVLNVWAPEKPRESYIHPVDLPRWYSEVSALPEGDRDFYLLLLLTGLRFNELALLTWREVDLVGGFVKLEGDRVKNGHNHDIALSTQARFILSSRQEYSKTKLVFPNTRNDTKPFHHRRQHEHIHRRTGIVCNPHSLRRTFATVARYRCGADFQTVKRCLNHVSGDITDRYLVWESESLRPTFQAVADFVFLAFENAPIVAIPEVVTVEPAPKVKRSYKRRAIEFISLTAQQLAAIEGKILASICEGKNLKRDFYKKVGSGLKKHDLDLILIEMQSRGLICSDSVMTKYRHEYSRYWIVGLKLPTPS
jgi:integrase